MEGYNPALAFSAHIPYSQQQQRRSQTPKKKVNFPTKSPFTGRGVNQNKTPQKFQSPHRDPTNIVKNKPEYEYRPEQDYGSKLFNSGHNKFPKYNPENGSGNRFQKQEKSFMQRPPYTKGKQRKTSENNITFENKLANNMDKKQRFGGVIQQKERRGSCTNLWMNNFAQKYQKPTRLSMVNSDQMQNMAEKKAKKVRRGWDQNNQFSMQQTLEDETDASSFITPQMKQSKNQVPKQRKYSDNSGVKKSPSFLNSTKNIDVKKLPMTIKPKMSIQKFKIIKQLGNGAYGRVVLAQQKETGFICAIKILSKKDLKEENMVQQFIRQIKTQCFFNHPNIIKVYGYFDDLLHLYIIMECALDQRLSDILKLHTLAQNQGATVFYQLCSAITQLHSELVIHRDLKPQNIMLHQGVVKICDFGWSVYRGSQLRTTFCGTPLYLSPQILVGDSYDESVDVWALGIILYEMIIGEGPFKITCSQELTKILHQKVDLKSKEVSSQLQGIIQACLKKKSDERPSAKWLLNRQWSKRGRPDEVKRFSTQNDL